MSKKNNKKFANRDEFLTTVVNPIAKELFVYLFSMVDIREDLQSNLGTAGFSVNVDNPNTPNKHIVPLFYAFGNKVVNDNKKHCIEPQYKRMSNKASDKSVDDFKSGINRLDFFSSSPSNPLWQLTDVSTKNEIDKLMSIIDRVANRVKAELLKQQ